MTQKKTFLACRSRRGGCETCHGLRDLDLLYQLNIPGIGPRPPIRNWILFFPDLLIYFRRWAPTDLLKSAGQHGMAPAELL